MSIWLFSRGGQEVFGLFVPLVSEEVKRAGGQGGVLARFVGEWMDGTGACVA